MNEGHIFIDEQITPDTYKMVQKAIAEYAGREKLVLHIASPGGSVYAGYNIYNALKLSKKPIKTIIEGEAQSMATFIALAGDEIEICNPSVFMIHMPHSGVEGTAENFEQGASELRAIENDMIAAYAAKTKLPPEQIREMMRKTTTLNASQAKEFGFADKVLGSYTQAVALGQTIKKPMETKEKKFVKILTMVGEALGVVTPTAMDVKTADGKVLTISEDGKTATLDGQPASGSIALADGRTIICENGAVVSIQEAAAAPQPVPAPAPAPPVPAPVPAPLTAEAQKLIEAEALVKKLQAEKEQTEKELQKTVQALAVKNKEMNEPVGNQEPPAIVSEPAAIGARTNPQAMGINATRTFLADQLPWIERYYKDGKYTDKGDGNGKMSDGSRLSDYRSNGPNAVSILETNFNYTWNGILSTDLFFKPSLDTPALSDFFTIDLGAKDKKRYNLVNPISKVLKPYTGCGGTPTGTRQLITNTTIQMKPFQMYESFCKDDFTGQLTGTFNFLAQEWLKSGNASFDPAGTPINNIIMDSLKDALRRDVFRRAFFAAGNSSSADFNQIDGFFDRIIDSAGASNYCVYKYGATLGTGALATDAAATYFKGIYENSSRLLKQEQIDKDKSTFWVTRSVWENYYNTLVGTGAVTEQAYSDFKSGVKTLEFRGHPVKPVTIWDEDLTDSNNPLFATTRHLIVFTNKKNHILGVENTGDLEKIESWYELKDQKRYYRANMGLGYQYLHCDLTSIAY
jgi:ATP-dependent Clp endopeptidase proteolytic subunit ClpP